MSRAAAGALLLVALLAVPAAAEAPPEPGDYRQDAYQATPPATLRGVPAMTTEAARRLWSGRAALFIDVLPHVPRPSGLPAGTLWNEKPHRSIPGAVWLPEVGRGTLAAETEDYFKRNLESLTGSRRDRPLVIFCKRSCWMSWNAARRAQSYGYTGVSWYADGVDGWADAGLPLEPADPRP